MAGIDKITTMRRLIIANAESGHILWEGVDIEGNVVLRKTFSDTLIWTTTIQGLNDWLEDEKREADLFKRPNLKLWIIDPVEMIDVRDLRDKESSNEL